jgi:DNA-binding response OmpR family regulator
MARILIIEDSLTQVAQLTRALKESISPFEVEVAYNGREGLSLARTNPPDLIVLDLGLPEKDGLDVLRELRREDSTRHIAVVLATGKSDVADQLTGFALGADDYVVKPYHAKILVARIETILSRRRHDPSLLKSEVVERHGLRVDRYRHLATLHGVVIPLTPTEFRLLDLLIRRPGRVFTRGELMDALVGEDSAILAGSINVYVGNLRQKLGLSGTLIETVRSVGYRMRAESDA